MAKEGFFQKIKSLLTQGSEEAIDEFAEAEVADTSIQDPEVSELPSFEYKPMVEGLVEATAEFFDRSADVGREVDHVDIRYRQEHEPYRYEPDGDRTLCITKAHLCEIHPQAGLAGLAAGNPDTSVRIFDLMPLKIKVLPDTTVIYTTFHTNSHGAIIPDPEHPEIDNPNYDADNPDPAEPAKIPDPDYGIYRLDQGESLPESKHFILPSEAKTDGSEGQYFIPIVYIKDGKLERNFWNNEETPPRQTQLYGGLDGHRGPYWWHRGYNAINNLGVGKNIYKNYDATFDIKNFRSLDERSSVALGQSDENGDPITTDRKDADGNDLVNPPFSGEAQVKVQYAEGGDEIHIQGNDYNKYWKIGGQGVGIVEDGLVTCLSDLNCKDFATSDLNTTTVISSASSYTSVLSGSSTVSVPRNPDINNVTAVLTSAGVVTVALEPEESNLVSVVSASAVTTAAAPVTSGNMTSVAQGPSNSDFANDVWSGGTASAGGGLTAVKVAGCGSTGGSGDTCYWVLGYEATGQYSSSPPTFPSFITGANQSTPVIKSLSTTDVVETTTDLSVIQSSGSSVSVIASLSTSEVATAGNTVNVLMSNLTPVDVLTSTDTVAVLSAATTVDVFAPTGTAHTTVIREATSTELESENFSSIKVVECPTTASCPPPSSSE